MILVLLRGRTLSYIVLLKRITSAKDDFSYKDNMRDALRMKPAEAITAAIPEHTRRDLGLPEVPGKALAVVGVRRSGKIGLEFVKASQSGQFCRVSGGALANSRMRGPGGGPARGLPQWQPQAIMTSEEQACLSSAEGPLRRVSRSVVNAMIGSPRYGHRPDGRVATHCHRLGLQPRSTGEDPVLEGGQALEVWREAVDSWLDSGSGHPLVRDRVLPC